MSATRIPEINWSAIAHPIIVSGIGGICILLSACKTSMPAFVQKFSAHADEPHSSPARELASTEPPAAVAASSEPTPVSAVTTSRELIEPAPACPPAGSIRGGHFLGWRPFQKPLDRATGGQLKNGWNDRVRVAAKNLAEERRLEAVEAVAMLDPVLESSLETHVVPIYSKVGTHTEVSVFYGTDRNRADDNTGVVAYGRERGNFEYGTVQVSIPKDHQLAALEAPAWWKLQFYPDRERHVLMGAPLPMAADDFFKTLRATVQSTKGKSAFVFIHGYNVSFEDAIRRTGQLAYDLQFDGVPVCYSWPSRATTKDYLIDGTNADWTVPHLEAFLDDVAERSAAEHIVLVAHSMGNRALSRACTTLFSRSESKLKERCKSIVLAAPDIDAAVFREQIAPMFVRSGKPVTLYASSRDKALKLAKGINGYPRAGDAGDGLVVVEGIETVDASDVDTSFIGHSYLGDSRTLVFDLFYLIYHGFPASRRAALEPMTLGSLVYYRFRR